MNEWTPVAVELFFTLRFLGLLPAEHVSLDSLKVKGIIPEEGGQQKLDNYPPAKQWQQMSS